MLIEIETSDGPKKVRVCDHCRTVCVPRGRFCSGSCARRAEEFRNANRLAGPLPEVQPSGTTAGTGTASVAGTDTCCRATLEGHGATVPEPGRERLPERAGAESDLCDLIGGDSDGSDFGVGGVFGAGELNQEQVSNAGRKPPDNTSSESRQQAVAYGTAGNHGGLLDRRFPGDDQGRALT